MPGPTYMVRLAPPAQVVSLPSAPPDPAAAAAEAPKPAPRVYSQRLDHPEVVDGSDDGRHDDDTLVAHAERGHGRSFAERMADLTSLIDAIAFHKLDCRLAAALHGRIDVVGSEVRQKNFPDHPLLTLAQSAAADSQTIASSSRPSARARRPRARSRVAMRRRSPKSGATARR